MAVIDAHRSTRGADFYALVQAYNSLATKHNALCAKLDLDAGVTDTTYVSLNGGADTINLNY